MRSRSTLAVGLVGVLLAAAAAPSMAGPKPKPKPKPKPIKGSYMATALPDPTSTLPTGGPCEPHSPVGMDHHAFKIPAAGTLAVSLDNKLDWSVAIRTAAGDTESAADGSDVDTKESTSAAFKKAQTVYIDACNFLGEQEVLVSYTFTYK